MTTTARRPVRPINPWQNQVDVIQQIIHTYQEADAQSLQIILDVIEKNFSTLNNRLDEIEKRIVTPTTIVELTPQENLQSELPPDLQLWMGRVEGLLVGQQRQIDILTGMITALVQQQSVQLSEIEHHTKPDIALVEGKVEQVEQQSKASERVERQRERTRELLYTRPDISVREVAKILGCSVGTAQSRMTEAREILWKDRP